MGGIVENQVALTAEAITGRDTDAATRASTLSSARSSSS